MQRFEVTLMGAAEVKQFEDGLVRLEMLIIGELRRKFCKISAFVASHYFKECSRQKRNTKHCILSRSVYHFYLSKCLASASAEISTFSSELDSISYRSAVAEKSRYVISALVLSSDLFLVYCFLNENESVRTSLRA
jgi:hypothetical protein